MPDAHRQRVLARGRARGLDRAADLGDGEAVVTEVAAVPAAGPDAVEVSDLTAAGSSTFDSSTLIRICMTDLPR